MKNDENLREEKGKKRRRDVKGINTSVGVQTRVT